MKRRTFVKTVLGALGAVGFGKKLIETTGTLTLSDPENVIGKEYSLISGPYKVNEVPTNSEGIWARKIQVGHEDLLQFHFVTNAEIEIYRRHYKKSLSRGIGPYEGIEEIILWVANPGYYLKLPSKLIIT